MALLVGVAVWDDEDVAEMEALSDAEVDAVLEVVSVLVRDVLLVVE